MSEVAFANFTDKAPPAIPGEPTRVTVAQVIAQLRAFAPDTPVYAFDEVTDIGAFAVEAGTVTRFQYLTGEIAQYETMYWNHPDLADEPNRASWPAVLIRGLGMPLL